MIDKVPDNEEVVKADPSVDRREAFAAAVAESKKRRKPGCCFFVLLTVSSFIVGLLLFTLGILYLFYTGYDSWEAEFETPNATRVEVSAAHDKVRESTQKKIEAFNTSSESVDTVQFSVEEVGVILFDGISSSLPDGFILERIYVTPDTGEWDVALKVNYKNTPLPWVEMSVVKDNIQTAELYISDLRVGEYSIEEYGLGPVLDQINDGYRDGLISVNENSFTERVFENIELEADGVLVKGRR